MGAASSGWPLTRLGEPSCSGGASFEPASSRTGSGSGSGVAAFESGPAAGTALGSGAWNSNATGGAAAAVFLVVRARVDRDRSSRGTSPRTSVPASAACATTWAGSADPSPGGVPAFVACRRSSSPAKGDEVGAAAGESLGGAAAAFFFGADRLAVAFLTGLFAGVSCEARFC
ncbi:MAG: hypothetical protein WKF82_02335 [Nocardioidaceae bacterium]